MESILRVTFHEVCRFENVREKEHVDVIHYRDGKLTGIVYRGADEFPLRPREPISERFLLDFAA